MKYTCKHVQLKRKYHNTLELSREPTVFLTFMVSTIKKTQN